MFEAPGTILRKALSLALAVLLSSVACASSNFGDGDDAVLPLSADAIDEIDTEAEMLDGKESPNVAVEENAVRAALPGVSEEDTRAFRREMYRTDI